MTPPKKLWSDIKYWIFLLLFFFVLFEMVSSMILYRKYTTGKLATLHFIKDEKPAFAYEPWLMFRTADEHSGSVNIQGFERKSNPSVITFPESKDTFNVFFFGGANMHGKNLGDQETIPSRFLEFCQASGLNKTIRVRNFGIPWYYSKQELMLLSSLIFNGQKPDMVIFLDGLTDFYPARMLYYDKPYFSYALQQTFEGKMFQKGDGHFIDSTKQLFDNPPGVEDNEFNRELISKYINNIKYAASLCSEAYIKPYFFCEPVPFYNYPALKDTSGFQGNYKRFNNIYSSLENNTDTTLNLHFLGNMLQLENDSAVTSAVSYSPAFAKKVAKQIFETVKSDLQ